MYRWTKKESSSGSKTGDRAMPKAEKEKLQRGKKNQLFLTWCSLERIKLFRFLICNDTVSKTVRYTVVSLYETRYVCNFYAEWILNGKNSEKGNQFLFIYDILDSFIYFQYSSFNYNLKIIHLLNKYYTIPCIIISNMRTRKLISIYIHSANNQRYNLEI